MSKWTNAVLAWVLLFSCWPAASAGADAEAAQRRFERGVALAADRRWEEAAEAFEDSARELDRFATCFNLVVLYDQLDRPLDVVRHGLHLLNLSDAQGVGPARERAAALVIKARARLALIDTRALASDEQLRLDGAPPAVSDTDGVYARPGPHVLEVCAPDIACRTSNLEVSAGEVSVPARPERQQTHEPQARGPRASTESGSEPMSRASAPDSGVATWRTKTARALAGIGGAVELSAWMTYGMSVRRARLLEARDPFVDGIDQVATRYWRARNAVFPLAFAGGALMAAAAGLAGREHPGKRGWFVTCLAAGAAAAVAGVVVSALPPAKLRSRNTEQPTRQAGALMLSLSFPLLGYGSSGWFARRP